MRLHKLLRKIISVVLLISIVYLFAFFDTGYLTVQPGSAILVEDLVEIEGYPYEEGNLFLLTVSQQRATPILFAYAMVSRKIDLIRQDLVIPPDMDIQEYYELSKEMMVNSQLKAKYVALNYAKIDAEISSDGVLLEGIMPTGSAYGTLEEGDLILEVEGEPVYFDEQVITKIRAKSIGDTISMRVNREGKVLDLEVLIGESPTQPQTPALGIWVRNKELTLTAPIDIKINTGNIGGPSAGMMFVLEIYNRLTDEDVTKGMNIAGTGEIRWDGTVAPIGGMKQKVFAAERKEAQILFVPVENYDEAVKYATKIDVVKVANFDEVLQYLKNR